MTVDKDNFWYVTAGYAITWIVIIGYTIRVQAALSSARKEHDAAMAGQERAS